jgi:hypothetical protein
MLYEQNLEGLIFNRHKMIESDELVILSGYLGPNPVTKLKQLPINATVIYGMYGDKGIQHRLHNALIDTQLNVPNVDIYYSTIPVHSKCYIWKYKNEVKHALIGSANFSTNGLSTPYREILAETTYDTFQPLQKYVDRVMTNSILCTDVELNQPSKRIITTPNTQVLTEFCKMSFLGRGDILYTASGLNWGQGNAHNNLNDAYITIKKDYIKQYPHLFPPKQDFATITNVGGKPNRHNDAIEIIWDDGMIMDGLLEGSQDERGLKYPKQITSFPGKNLMGEYLRRRLGVKSGQPVSIGDLQRYGRTDIDISLQDEGIYYFDFSV